MTSNHLCRWGFLGAANISRKNWKSVRLSGNGVVTAVASRDLARAESFISECSLEVPPVTRDLDGQVQLRKPTAYGDYESLIQSDDVDAVYIALPTGVRKEWVLAAAAAGKHVICEKPVAVHGDDAEEMITACRAAGVGFMDGVMFDHSARLLELRKQIDAPETFGKLRRIQTHFSFFGGESFADANIRADHRLEPHGCLGDLGWYCIRMTLWGAGDRMPVAVSGRSIVLLDGGRVPGEFQAEMKFDDGLSAGFFCSFRTVNQQTALFSGDRGYISLDDFVLPFVGAESGWNRHNHELLIDNCRWNFGRHTAAESVREHGSGEPDSQEVRMFRSFADNVLNGQPCHRASTIALKTQRVLDALRQSDISDGTWVPVDSVDSLHRREPIRKGG